MKQVWSCPQCLDGTFPTVGFDFSSSAFICHLCGTRLESLELTEDSVDSFPSPENAGSGYNGQHAGPPNILNSRGSGYILLPPGWKHHIKLRAYPGQANHIALCGCGRSYGNMSNSANSNLVRHIRDELGAYPTPFCDTCGMVFKAPRYLDTHKKRSRKHSNVSHHGSNDMISRSGSKYECPHCKKKFPTRDELYAHLNNKHRPELQGASHRG
ncbi:uncharacterized protein PV06_01895 [Exophiala oligosperma]|uniref:C2H2-type domain-containing protein n=1 Tax=Exophiala oligosperma TaxID=215243 RepID=A0A0D2C8Q6_9EURO|nr:uncharacterized protein PV06_01895 [Exophiala oligosperma]KIW46212.1 hypothetical protein PV06_01895 [Exophiala oligosperma]